MNIEENNARFANYYKWETRLHEPYNYLRNGLVKHLLSPRIVESKNSFLQSVLSIYETSIEYVLKSIDYVKNFKNYNWKN